MTRRLSILTSVASSWRTALPRVTGPWSIAPRILALSASSSYGLGPLSSSSSMAAASSELRALSARSLSVKASIRGRQRSSSILPASKALK